MQILASELLRFLSLDDHWGAGRNVGITQAAYIKELRDRYQK